MSKSLQDQLLKAGLADKKQAKKAHVDKRKAKKRKKRNPEQAEASDPAAERARQAREEKAARDRELNRQRQEEKERRAREAEIRQLISANKVDRRKASEAYHFADGEKVFSLDIHGRMRRDLAEGRLRIVRHDNRYEVVPADVAGRIAERDAACVMPLPSTETDPSPGDPYDEYPVPDDLVW